MTGIRDEQRQPRIAVIGAGPAGIGTGRELLRKGFTDFTIFDALDAPGGRSGNWQTTVVTRL